MQAVLSATLSRLYCVFGDFHVSTDTLMQNFLLVFWFLLLTCLSLRNTQARAVNLIHAVLCDDEGVTLDVSLCNTQARAVNLIPAILCDDEGVAQARYLSI